MNPKLQSLYGLKFNPFRPDVPVEALYVTPAVDAFLRRVQLGIAAGRSKSMHWARQNLEAELPCIHGYD